MYVAGICVLAIGRTLGVKPGTIYSWLKKVHPGPNCAASVPAAAATVAVGAGPGDCLWRSVDLCGGPAAWQAAFPLGVDGGG